MSGRGVRGSPYFVFQYFSGERRRLGIGWTDLRVLLSPADDDTIGFATVEARHHSFYDETLLLKALSKRLIGEAYDSAAPQIIGGILERSGESCLINLWWVIAAYAI